MSIRAETECALIHLCHLVLAHPGGPPDEKDWDVVFDKASAALSLLQAEERRKENGGGHFDGETYNPALDYDRLKKQLGRVFNLMADGKWRTLGEIAAALADPEASVSARLRDLRKPKFGNYKVPRRRRGSVKAGLWEYCLLSPSGDGVAALAPAQETEKGVTHGEFRKSNVVNFD